MPPSLAPTIAESKGFTGIFSTRHSTSIMHIGHPPLEPSSVANPDPGPSSKSGHKNHIWSNLHDFLDRNELVSLPQRPVSGATPVEGDHRVAPTCWSPDREASPGLHPTPRPDMSAPHGRHSASQHIKSSPSLHREDDSRHTPWRPPRAFSNHCKEEEASPPYHGGRGGGLGAVIGVYRYK
jgi:hypothetical protein